MTKTQKELLIRWLMAVMYMICSRPDWFSEKDRFELATLTHELTEDLKAN